MTDADTIPLVHAVFGVPALQAAEPWSQDRAPAQAGRELAARDVPFFSETPNLAVLNGWAPLLSADGLSGWLAD